MNRGREIYNNLHQPVRDDVDQAFNVLHAFLINRGYRVIGDDRAEKVVDAICIYIEDSKLKRQTLPN